MGWGALVKLLPAVAGWVGQAVSVTTERARAQLERQAAVATSSVGLFLVAFWFYPAIANYFPLLRQSAGEGFKLLVDAPEWYYQLLIAITFVVLGLGKASRSIEKRSRE